MYKGDSLLRGPGEKIKYTDEMLKEFMLCKNDINYFAENYFKIITIDHGEQTIALRDYQKQILSDFKNPPNGLRHNVLLSGRQSGKCSFPSVKIKIKNKKTGLIEEISFLDFFNRIKKSELREV